MQAGAFEAEIVSARMLASRAEEELQRVTSEHSVQNRSLVSDVFVFCVLTRHNTHTPYTYTHSHSLSHTHT